METALGPDYADFLWAPIADPVRTGEFDRAFGRFRAGSQQENLVQAFWRQLNQIFGELSAFFAWKHIVVQQTAAHLVDDRLAHFGRTVAAIGHQDTAAPIEPLISVFVINVNILRALPHQRRLAAHGLRLEFAQRFDSGEGIRMRQRSNDATMFRLNDGDGAGCDAEFFAHKTLRANYLRFLSNPSRVNVLEHFSGSRSVRIHDRDAVRAKARRYRSSLALLQICKVQISYQARGMHDSDGNARVFRGGINLCQALARCVEEFHPANRC